MSIRQHILQWSSFSWLCLIIFSLSSCQVEREMRVKQSEDSMAYLRFALRTNSGEYAQKESNIMNVHVVVASALDGSIVYKDGLNLSDSGDHKVSDPIMLPKGTYDFYFFANRPAMGMSAIDAIKTMTHISAFTQNKVFREILYHNSPSVIRPEGIAMSARYKRVTIPDQDYTDPNNPWYFNPQGEPTKRDYLIKLIRAYARVDLVFKNDPRLLVAPIPAAPYKEITSIEVTNVPRYYSVPPYDKDFLTTYEQVSDPTLSLSWDKATLQQKGFKYNAEEIGTLTFYIPEFIHYLTQNLDNAVKINIKGENGLNKTFKLTHGNFDDYNQQGHRDLEHNILSPNTVLRNTHYTVEFTIRPDNPSQPDNNDVRIKVKEWEPVEFTPPPFGSFLHVPDQVIFIGKLEDAEEDYYIPYYSSHPVGLGDMDPLDTAPWIKQLKLLNRDKQELSGDTQGYIYVKVAKKWDPDSGRNLSTPYNVRLHSNHSAASDDEVGAFEVLVRLYLRSPQEGDIPFWPPPDDPDPYPNPI